MKPTSNKQVGEHSFIITLTDDNVYPLSRNYTLSLTVVENPSLIEDPAPVEDESNSARIV